VPSLLAWLVTIATRASYQHVRIHFFPAVIIVWN
jgi:hypothetical protein